MPLGCLRVKTQPRPRPGARSSSSTPISIPTKRRISGICATPCWVIRSPGCCARAAAMLKCRTISTTRACRLRTWWRDFISSKKKPAADVGVADERRDAIRLHLLGSLRASLAVLQRSTRIPSRGARRRCTPSKRARANWRNWRIWWPTRSSTRISQPCCG